MTALGTLHDVISRHETVHPDAVFVMVGDFNHCNLKNILPKYHQHVHFPTRKCKDLDQVYSNMKDSYGAVPRPYAPTEGTHNTLNP